MNLRKLLPIALCTMLTFTSCNDDDDNMVIPTAVETSFVQKYPTAASVKWEKDHQYAIPYLKAEFKVNGIEAEAWYTEDGNWVKTETDYFGELPQAIENYIASYYAGFHKDDVEWVECPNGNFFKVELEKGKHKVELSITEEGTVLFIQDNQEKVPADVLKSFEAKYPNTTVKEWEKEGLFLKAEFYTNNVQTAAWFTYNGTWVKSETDFKGTLPQTVTDYIATNYTAYKINEIHWVETPEKNFFEIKLENGKEEIILSIMEDGTLIKTAPDLD